MKRLHRPHSAPARFFGAMLLLFAGVALAATSTVEAAIIVDQVDIINGEVDVNESSVINAADDMTNVILFFNNAAPIHVDIINGEVDVNESGAVNAADDLLNVDLNDERVHNQVDIINGLIDVNEDGVINVLDAATNVDLVRLPRAP